MASKAKQSKLEQPKVASSAEFKTPTEEPSASTEAIAETSSPEFKTPSEDASASTEKIAETSSAEFKTPFAEPSTSTEKIAETPKERKKYKEILSYRIPATEKRGFEISLFATSNHLASKDMMFQLSSHATDFQNTFKITLKEEELRFLGDELNTGKLYTECKAENSPRVVKLTLHRSTKVPSFVYKMITVMPRGEKKVESDVNCYAIKFTIPRGACKPVSTAMKNILYLVAVAREGQESNEEPKVYKEGFLNAFFSLLKRLNFSDAIRDQLVKNASEKMNLPLASWFEPRFEVDMHSEEPALVPTNLLFSNLL